MILVKLQTVKTGSTLGVHFEIQCPNREYYGSTLCSTSVPQIPKFIYLDLYIYIGRSSFLDLGAISSVGRASRLHREGREFESLIAHQHSGV